ncbi:MAG: sensor histidine kinase, partial [Caulobacteraceae bacterium]
REAGLAERLARRERALAERTAALRRAESGAAAATAQTLAGARQALAAPMAALIAALPRFGTGDAAAAEALSRAAASLVDLDDLAPGAPLDAAPTDPSEAVEDIVALFFETAREKGVDLAAYVDPAIPASIEADPKRLRQVIGALTGYLVEQARGGAVFIQTAPHGERLRIAARHNGEAASDDSVVGLARCRRLAHAMGGRVIGGAPSSGGRGFALDLPMKALAPAPAWPKLAEDTVAIRIEGAATKAALQRYLAAAGLAVAPDQGGEAPGLLLAEPATLTGAPRSAAPVICLAPPGSSEAETLRAAGLSDLTLAAPVKRADLAAALARLADGKPLADAPAPPPAAAKTE